jgi:hypothetical protein
MAEQNSNKKQCHISCSDPGAPESLKKAKQLNHLNVFEIIG